VLQEDGSATGGFVGPVEDGRKKDFPGLQNIHTKMNVHTAYDSGSWASFQLFLFVSASALELYRKTTVGIEALLAQQPRTRWDTGLLAGPPPPPLSPNLHA